MLAEDAKTPGSNGALSWIISALSMLAKAIAAS
jgi:hypothetical protein